MDQPEWTLDELKTLHAALTTKYTAVPMDGQEGGPVVLAPMPGRYGR